MAYTIDKHDLKILQRIRDEGPMFMKHPTHEFRASSMRHAGFVTGEQAVYRMTSGGATVEIRTRYSINDTGRTRLESEARTTCP